MIAGRMMDRPLLIIDILKHAADAHPTIEIVSRTVEGPIHRYGYADAFKRTAQLAHDATAAEVEAGAAGAGAGRDCIQRALGEEAEDAP